MAVISWNDVFVPTTPLFELFVRGTLMYLGLFVLLRVVAKRSLGALGIQDLLVIVLIADAAQNAMAADYRSISEGIVLCATIVFWSYSLDWLSLRSTWVRKMLEPPPLELVRSGRMQRRNMRREMITEEELMSNLRVHGIEDLKSVKAAFIEPDGEISVIRNKAGGDEDNRPRRKGAR